MGIQVLVPTRKEPRTLEGDFIVQVDDISEEQYDAIANEDSRYELLDNVLIMHSPASVEHEELFGFAFRLLGNYVEHRDLGLVLGSQALIHPKLGRRLAPDLMFLSHDRAHLVGTQVEGTADLVIEILSPSTRAFDLGDKRRAYQEARTPEIWFIDPMRRSVVADTRSGRAYKSRALSSGVLHSRAVKGFWVDVSWFWRRPLPRAVDCLQKVLEA